MIALPRKRRARCLGCGELFTVRLGRRWCPGCGGVNQAGLPTPAEIVSRSLEMRIKHFAEMRAGLWSDGGGHRKQRKAEDDGPRGLVDDLFGEPSGWRV